MNFKHLIALLLFYPWHSYSQEYFEKGGIVYGNKIYTDNVQSVFLNPMGNPLGFPAIRLRSADRLILRFDDFDQGVKNYQYTLVHCNADWTPSKLSKAEYMGSMQEFFITDYDFSFNTLVPYTHFHLMLPNKNMNFTISGNYLLIVYDGTIDNPVITRRFIVYEEIANVGVQVKRATQVEDNMSKQEVDVIVSHPDYVIPDPFQDVKMTIIQNYRWDNAITNLKPNFVSATQMTYNYDKENTFNGLNEFRFFDIKNLQVLSMNVRRTVLEDLWTVYIAPEAKRSHSRYVFWEDINGMFVARKLDARNYDTEADYAWVDFYLESESPYLEGDVYVWGHLSDWKTSPYFKMKYNYDRKAYEAQILLKQGFYNYMYAIQKDNGEIDPAPIEGNFWETENEYHVFVYHREIGIRYDKVIGYGNIKFRN